MVEGVWYSFLSSDRSRDGRHDAVSRQACSPAWTPASCFRPPSVRPSWSPRRWRTPSQLWQKTEQLISRQEFRLQIRIHTVNKRKKYPADWQVTTTKSSPSELWTFFTFHFMYRYTTQILKKEYIFKAIFFFFRIYHVTLKNGLDPEPRSEIVVPRVKYLMNPRNREKICHGDTENPGEHCSQSVTTPRAGNSIKGIFSWFPAPTLTKRFAIKCLMFSARGKTNGISSKC